MFIQELWLPAVASGLQLHARATGRSLTAGPLLPIAVTRPSYIYFQELGCLFLQGAVVLEWVVWVTCSGELAADIWVFVMCSRVA